MQATKHDLETILNKRWRMEHLYKIRGEDRKLKCLKFNPVQEALFNRAQKKNNRGIRQMNLKARKQGVSTFWLIYYLDDTLWTPNTNSMIQSHVQKDMEKLFRIVKLAYQTCPKAVQLESGQVWLKPKANYDNVNELTFESINSTIFVALQNRGGTNNNLHISEAAHFKDRDRILASIGSVPNVTFGSNLTIETTANGVGEWFHETWTECEDGTGPYEAVFFAWFDDPKHAIPAPPEFIPSEAEEELRAEVLERRGIELTNNQLFWYRMTQRQQKRLMPQEFPSFPEEAFLFSGKMSFDIDFVKSIEPKAPIRVLEVPVERRDGARYTYKVNIWSEPKPGRRYVVSADPAEGVQNDDTAIECYDTLTLEQVAELVSDTIPPEDAAIVVDKVARLFNDALIVPERNNHGHLLISRLLDINKNVYTQQIFDEKTNKKTKKVGWETNSHTRDLVLDEMEALARDATIKINSAILKSQLLTFIINDDGRREAKTGKKDDTILATAIALKVARLPRSTFTIYQLP